jgi:hypothetical protein
VAKVCKFAIKKSPIYFVLRSIFINFASMNKSMLKSEKWSENVILIDADYLDSVAFDLIVNFERMIGRRIPKADIAHWIDCIALDGGLREGDNNIQVVFIHNKDSKSLINFIPCKFEEDIDGKAFKDKIGEFMMSAFPVEDIVGKDDFFVDALELILNGEGVKRVMVIPDQDKTYEKVRVALHYANDEKRITLFAMQPMQGGNFRQEILGYSLMSALGIKSDEIR